MWKMWWNIWSTNIIWSCKFFHGFLAQAEPEEILGFLEKLKKDSEAIYSNIMEIAIYSEGKISYSELWNMSPYERNIFVKVLNNYQKKKNGQQGTEEL